MSQAARKRGAQPGNLNALKHGYYSKALDHAAQVRLSEARGLDPADLAEEVALLRERLWTLLNASPEKFELISLMARTLTRTVATHYAMGGTAAERLYTATERVLDDMREQLLKGGY